MEMSLRYNAILRDYGSMAVKGRKFIKDLKEVPPEFVVMYQGSYISKLTDLETLFCDRYNPLHLVKFPPADEKLIVLVKDKTTGRMFAIDVEDENVTVEDFKRKLSDTETRYKPDDLRLSVIKTEKKLIAGQTLKECGIKWGKVDILEMERGLTGGGGGGGYPAFISVNLKGNPENGMGVPKCYSWETYGYGMNLSGTCNEPGCISKLTKSKEVILNMEYGRIRMKKGWSRFYCPACLISDEERKLFYQRRGLPVPPLPSSANPNPVPGPSTQVKTKEEGDEEKVDEEEGVQRGHRVRGTFTPTGFLLTCGRAMFRFKKQGANQSVETVSMAALGPISEYTSFECSTHGLTTYDFIEITTVAKYSSPMSCIQCFRQITDEHKKVALPCQHFFHPLCITELGGKRKCPVCSYSYSQDDSENTETENSDDDDEREMMLMRGIDVDTKNKTPENLANTALNWNYNYQLFGEYAHAAEIDPWTHEIDDCVFLRAYEAKKSQRAKRKEEMFMVTRSGKRMKKIQVKVKW